MDEEDLDLNGISIPQYNENRVLHIYSMKKHFASLWDNGETHLFKFSMVNY